MGLTMLGAERHREELSAARAVHALLTSLEVRVPIANIWQGTSREPPLQRAASVLSMKGFPARVVRVAAKEVSKLALPTLGMLQDGTTVLVLSANTRGLVIEGSSGEEHSLPMDSLKSEWGGLAIERQAPRDATRTFVPMVLAYVLAHRLELTKLGAIALLGALFTLVPPWLVRQVFDHVLPTANAPLLGALVFALLWVGLQQAWLGWLRSWVRVRAETLISRESIEELFRRLMEGRFHDVASRPIGELLQTLSSAEAAATSVVGLVTTPIFDAAALAVGLFAVATVSLSLSLSLLALALPTLVLAGWFSHREAKLKAAEILARATQRASLHELLAGVTTIKALGAERVRTRAWLGLMVDERSLTLRGQRASLSRDISLEAGQRGAGVMAFAIAGTACLAGEISVGAFLMATTMADVAMRGCRNLANHVTPLLNLREYGKKVDGALPAAEDVTVRDQSLRNDGPAIVLSDVWFRYGPSEPWILEGYNLRVGAGEHISLSGVSGAGKTTILRLIAGLYVPERGSVLVLGKNPCSVRDRMTYIPQKTHLFEGSIAYNLRLLGAANQQQVEAAAQATGLAEWLATLPMGSNTILPPGAPNLSGGEKQWIVLTAAVAAGREIVLLDESLSQMDRLRSARINLQKLFRGRTLVKISHEQRAMAT